MEQEKTTGQPAIKREAQTNQLAAERDAATKTGDQLPETNTPRVTEVHSTPREHQRPDLEVGVVPPYDQANVERIKAQQEVAQQ